MKKWGIILLLCSLLLTLISCGTTAVSPQTPVRMFTDSLGRTVEIPAKIEKISATGPTAQLALFALCPEKLAGLAVPWDSSAMEYLDASYFDLPVFGQLYGGKGELNLETLLQSGTELILDIGEAKDGLADELDTLQQQIGIPIVHISAEMETMGAAYRLLGQLFDLTQEAETLAAYCDEIYAMGCQLAERREKVRALYVLGPTGQNVVARDSYHSEIFDLLCDNLAIVDQPTAKGTGNEVGMEQILLWDPDYIVFAPDSIYDRAANDPTWQTLKAIQNGSYCQVPAGPDNWMGFPPGVQRCLGMLWLGKVFYGEAATYDLYTEVARFYRLFYHCELTQAQFAALTANSGV